MRLGYAFADLVGATQVLFFIFTLVMFYEQLTSILEDVTTIESFKGTVRADLSAYYLTHC
jgi:hypothetical protein